MHFHRSFALLACSLLTSCTTSHWYDYRFTPAPLETQVATEADPGSQLRVLVSVLGVSRGEKGGSDRVEIRMRLENLGTVPAALEAQSLSLVATDLESFGAAEVDPAAELSVSPGGNVLVDASFALPAGRKPSQVDFSGLNLRWTTVFGSHRVTTGATFQRSVPSVIYVEEPRWQFGVGYRFCR